MVSKKDNMIEESHVIDPNGEVMIILRNANAPFAVYGTPEQLRAGQTKDDIHEDVRIQVSAKHLMLASPVFEKALTGPWKEGVSLDMKGSTEISAENWDTEALLTFLRVIHCQFQSVPQEMSLELLAKVAVISDYYGCQGALRFFSRVWVQEKIIPRNYSRDLILWLWITWFFDLSGEFHNATSIAMSQCSGEIPSLGLPIPPTIIEHMNTLKKASLMEIWSLLEGARVRLLHGEHGCHFECRAMLYGVLSMHMHDNQLGWPIILEQSYEKSAQAIESVRRPRWREPCNDSGTTASNRRLHNCPDCNFTRLLGHVEQSVEGLDLDT